MCYLKIISIFSQNNARTLKKIVQEIKNGIEILVGQVVFKLWFKTVKIMFWSITQEQIGLLKFNAIFESLDNLL